MERNSSVYENTEFWKNNVINNNGLVELKEDITLPKIDGFNLSGKYDSKAEYVLFDVNDILNNSKNLFKEIREDSLYGQLMDEKNGTGINTIQKSSPFYKNFYSKSNNLTTYNSFNVWDIDVCKNLVKSSGDDILGDLNKTILDDYNPSGGTYGSKYINITNLKTISNVDYDDLMIPSDLYRNQSSNYSRALLLLSTFPFRDFTEGFLKSVFPNDKYNGARIVNIPKMYLYFIGSLLWRYEESTDPLNFGTFNNKNYSQFLTPKNEYLSKIGYNNKNKSIEENLKKLPISTKNTLINLFKDWVNQNFNNTFNGPFEKNVNTLVTPLNSISGNTNNVNDAKLYILSRKTNSETQNKNDISHKINCIFPIGFRRHCPASKRPVQNRHYSSMDRALQYFDQGLPDS